MSKKNVFDRLYIGIEDIMGSTVLYNSKGEYSVIFEIENVVEQYSADINAYYAFSDVMTSVIRLLGEGYALQKQDIFCKQKYEHEYSNMPFLSQAYFRFFNGREYTELKTYLIVTQEKPKKGFFNYDKKKFKDFHLKIAKLKDFLSGNGIKVRKLNEEEIKEYIYRYISFSFEKGKFTFNNFSVSDNDIKIGGKHLRCISLMDVGESNLPNTIKPYREEKIKGNDIASDILGFLSAVPGADCILYNQAIFILSQRVEKARLSRKRNRHASVPDPANDAAKEDIDAVLDDIERNGKLLVYLHCNLIVSSSKDLDNSCNYIESQLDKSSIRISKSAYNQLELFQCAAPGCAYYTNEEYDRFLTLNDAAACFLYKEKISGSEDTPLKMYYTNRAGIPKAIDITGKEGKVKLTDNSNFFSLGPSGSGKSFHMNSVCRQLYEQNTDIIMVDTGNSYEGLCSYVGGKYISYTEEKPITMNPFKITQEEDNIEKREFLKNLIILIWKGSDGTVSKAESKIIRMVISQYYASYFGGNKSVSEKLRDYRKSLRETVTDYDEELSEEEIEKLVEEERENITATHEVVEELNFNSFYEFAMKRIPCIVKEKKVKFDIEDFSFVMDDFYKGGVFERTLNDDMDKSLFDEKFIVFEIDAIKENPILFPIVTLIIMDLFIQKMRLKKNRKALIIEEAWKAIASDLMADYIKYLYKTVRKFWGIVGVVTQEIDDIISSPIVKDAIINNSQITILLDQSKFKERYSRIAELLGLSEVECNKIWTINSLDNRENRSYFKEVYIRRGSIGDVYGVEEPPECYMAYTTERAEKDGLKHYIKKYGNIQDAIENFCRDWKESGCQFAIDFVKQKKLVK